MNMLDGKVMPWLQEAMQTITMLESRLQELEEDCKAIPLHEQDRLEMIQEIQDLDAIVQQDQEWMDHAEIAVQWTTFVLENALISSSSSSHTNNNHNSNGSRRQSTRTRTRTGDMMPGLGRNTRSEGMLPSLVAERSSTLVKESQEAVYRNAIVVALRYLKTIDIAPSLSSVSSSSSKTSTRNGSGIKSTSRGHGSRQEQEEGVQDAAKQGKRRTRTRARARGAPDRALKEWLDNSSMMSLVSNIITEELLHDDEDEDEDEEGERVKDFSVSCVLATVEDMDSNTDRNTDASLSPTPRRAPKPRSKVH
ncbi:hypothetical protein BGX30_010340 [Mortierella sp. GBA39]|nr:hypothetical protein BGX30_010340 [Mortierella sp. GBA39]